MLCELFFSRNEYSYKQKAIVYREADYISIGQLEDTYVGLHHRNIPRNLPGGQAGNWHAFSSISVSASVQSCRQCLHLICRPLPHVTLQLLQSIHLPHLRRDLLLGIGFSPRANLEPLEDTTRDDALFPAEVTRPLLLARCRGLSAISDLETFARRFFSEEVLGVPSMTRRFAFLSTQMSVVVSLRSLTYTCNSFT